MKYRKRPVVIEAFQMGVDYIPDWFMDAVSSGKVVLHGAAKDDTSADIDTLEGTMRANYGDFVIRGIAGEIYPCKPDIFKETYEVAE